MNETKWCWSKIAGLGLHVVVGGLMLFAGSGKVFASPEVIEGLKKYGLADQVLLIGTGEILTAILLLVPRTSSLGVLLTSGFWGGTISFHMSHSEPYLLQSAMLVVTWVGAYLRNPATFSSFWAPPGLTRSVASGPGQGSA